MSDYLTRLNAAADFAPEDVAEEIRAAIKEVRDLRAETVRLSEKAALFAGLLIATKQARTEYGPFGKISGETLVQLDAAIARADAAREGK